MLILSNLKFVHFLLFLLSNEYVNGFYYFKEPDEIVDDENLTLIKDLKLKFDENYNTNEYDFKFPDSFYVSFNEFNKEFSIKFIKKIVDYKTSSDIYVIDKNSGVPVSHKLINNDEEKFECYLQENGNGFATLIQNKNYNASNPFRLIGTIYSKEINNLAFDIFPVMIKSKIEKRSLRHDKQRLYDSKSNFHGIQKRLHQNFLPADSADSNSVDYIFVKNTQEMLLEKIKKSHDIKKKKRALNGQPITLNVELLVVTDRTVFNDHQRIAGTTNIDLVFLHMRIYYAHLINGVNQRYQNSLSTDPDLRINVILTNFLFLTNSSDQNWVDPLLVGDSSYPIYNGKEVVVTIETLNAFTNFMNSKTFPFTFDHAVGLFNKDLWSADYTAQPSSRTGTAGFASIGRICTTDKYSIVEDFSGFSNIATIAHELGHNLGAVHDGILGTTSNCPSTDNFIMTPILSYSNNPINLQKFSSCSISQFKSILLSATLDAPSSQAQCLTNIPTNTPVENSYVNNVLVGQIWTPDDQCKMIYGSGSSFCRFQGPTICSALYCRPNSTQTSCLASGSLEGTTCDSGKICIQGICTASPIAPVDSCVFGDDIVTQDVIGIQLTSLQMNCSQVFNRITSLGQSISGFCADNRFGKICCQSCKKYNSLTCSDKYFDCPRYASYCNSATLNGVPLNQICQRTCGTCLAQPLRCSDSTFICQNGGTCTNVSVSQTSFFGFACICPLGYTGELCEQKTPCSPNPCANGGTCLQLGSLGHICQCPTSYSGYNCSNYLTSSTSTTKNSTITTSINTTPITTTTTRSTTSSTIIGTTTIGNITNPSTTSISSTTTPLVTTTSSNLTQSITTTNFINGSITNQITNTTSVPTNSTTTFRNLTTTTVAPINFTSISTNTLTTTATINQTYGMTDSTTSVQTVSTNSTSTTSSTLTTTQNQTNGVTNSTIFSTNSTSFFTITTPNLVNQTNIAINSTNLASSTSTGTTNALNGTSINPTSTSSITVTTSTIQTLTTSSILTTVTSTTSCQDYNSFVCAYFSVLGYCFYNSYLNGAPIAVSCPLACNQCSINCNDSQFNCIYWTNYCPLLISINPHPCKKTCRIC